LRVRADAKIGLKNPPEEFKARIQSKTVVIELMTADAMGFQNSDCKAIILEMKVMRASTIAPEIIDTCRPAWHG
jgi:hypothetical protein